MKKRCQNILTWRWTYMYIIAFSNLYTMLYISCHTSSSMRQHTVATGHGRRTCDSIYFCSNCTTFSTLASSMQTHQHVSQLPGLSSLAMANSASSFVVSLPCSNFLGLPPFFLVLRKLNSLCSVVICSSPCFRSHWYFPFISL